MFNRGFYKGMNIDRVTILKTGFQKDDEVGKATEIRAK